MRFPFPTATLLFTLLLSGVAHAEATACERFKQQYTQQYPIIECVDKQTAVIGKQQNDLVLALADSQNRLLVPFGTYDTIYSSEAFSQNGKLLLPVRSQDKEGVINRNGKQIVPPQYDDIFMPKEADEPIIVEKDQRYGLIDQTGKILMEPRYALIHTFSDGLALYTADPFLEEDNPNVRWGYLNTQGETTIAPQFADAQSFGSGVAWVKRTHNGNWLLIDRTGKTLLNAPNTYQDVDAFDKNGLARVQKNDLYGLINKRGESVLAAEYSHLTWLQDEAFYLIQKEEKFGATDAQGKVVIPTEFDAHTHWNPDNTPRGQIALMRGTTVYLFDQNGQQINQRPARYAQQCAHVAIGLPHKTQAGYRVSEIYIDNNMVRFINANGDDETGTCSDVASHKKGKTSKKRRS